MKNESVQDIIRTLIDHGGRLSSIRLRQAMSMNEVDYMRARDEAVNLGIIKIGRGRGGSITLVKEEHLRAAAEVATILLEEERASKKTRQKKTNEEEPPTPRPQLTEEEYSTEWQKANYELIPSDLNEFKPGMYVVRPPTYLYSEAEAWRNLRHYVVTHTDGTSVYVRNRYNTFAETMPTKPEGFYKPVRR